MTHRTAIPRLRIGVSLAVVLGVGVATQGADGTDWNWVARQLGGAFYVLAGILAVLFVFPSWSPARVCVGVLLATVAVEFAQLWQPDWLQSLRATRLGGLALGSTFHWADFPYYLLGYGLGLVWTRWLAR